MLIVQKFGGSSLAGTEGLRRSAQICRKARWTGDEVVAVVSAMGDGTDRLIDMAQELSPRPPAREMDALTTTGEQQSAALMAICLESLGLRAMSLTGWQAGILTDPCPGGSQIKLIAPGRIREALAKGAIPVVTGYQGFSRQGDVTTLGRGGSDITAVALAAALEADCCQIYTDVDGIYTADPRILKDAKKLDRIDFRDMLALAKAGSQVLHPGSVELAMANGAEISLLSSFSPGPGSLVCAMRDEARPGFAGVTRDREKGTVSLAGKEAGAQALSSLVLLLAREGIEAEEAWLEPGLVTVQVQREQQLRAMELIHQKVVLAQ